MLATLDAYEMQRGQARAGSGWTTLARPSDRTLDVCRLPSRARAPHPVSFRSSCTTDYCIRATCWPYNISLTVQLFFFSIKRIQGQLLMLLKSIQKIIKKKNW